MYFFNKYLVIRASGAQTPTSVTEKEIVEEGRKVRDFLQKLSERLAGGSLDEVTVNKMYHHPDCEWNIE